MFKRALILTILATAVAPDEELPDFYFAHQTVYKATLEKLTAQSDLGDGLRAKLVSALKTKSCRDSFIPISLKVSIAQRLIKQLQTDRPIQRDLVDALSSSISTALYSPSRELPCDQVPKGP